MDTRDTQRPNQAHGDPFYFRGRGWTDTQILPASAWPHLEKRGLPTPIIPCSWIPLGPLTHLDWDLRSTRGWGGTEA